ncbi:MAG: FRG domain-containing protein [Clostridioides sp.]|jgi:hypothetical protein|nr:FRG domain-containing protein [Clostridioides sp.]
MKKYKVGNISEYLSVLEDIDIAQFVYRGQNEPYFSIRASAFRPYKGGWNSDKIYDMRRLHSSFYDRIISQLSLDEKKYFLAYCQHHGIPTNLVDISYSPLVALFFACDGKKEYSFSLSEISGEKTLEEVEKDVSLQEMLVKNLIEKAKKSCYSDFAQIYMIKKERLIDITSLVVKLEGKNMFEELMSDDDVLSDLLDLVSSHFNLIGYNIVLIWLKNILSTYIEICDVYSEFLDPGDFQKEVKNILEEIDKFCGEDFEIEEENLKEVVESNLSQTFNSKKFYIKDRSLQIKETSLCIEDSEEFNITAQIYLAVLTEILSLLKNMPENLSINLDICFTYKPPELFTRMSSQQSFFIYQPYLYTNDTMFDYCELNVQKINPDVLIEIDNYIDILRELDVLGINNGTIYGDVDNIAKSVLKSSGILLKLK